MLYPILIASPEFAYGSFICGGGWREGSPLFCLNEGMCWKSLNRVWTMGYGFRGL